MYPNPYQQPYQQPYGAPPNNANKDLEHLKMLAIGHYVLGGIMALFGFFPLIYVLLGALVIAAPTRPGQAPPPTFVAWGFIAFGIIFSLIIWGLGGGLIFAGRQIAKHQKHTFCLVMAAVTCLMFAPFGTILGVFTFVVLLRDSVKQLFNNGGMPGNTYR